MATRRTLNVRGLRSMAVEPCGQQHEASRYDQQCQDSGYAAGNVIVLFAWRRRCHRSSPWAFFIPAKTDTSDQGLDRPIKGSQHPQIRWYLFSPMANTRIALD